MTQWLARSLQSLLAATTKVQSEDMYTALLCFVRYVIMSMTPWWHIKNSLKCCNKIFYISVT